LARQVRIGLVRQGQPEGVWLERSHGVVAPGGVNASLPGG